MSNEQILRKLNEQTKQDKSKIAILKISKPLNHKTDTEIDYFITCLEKEVNRAASAKTIQKLMMSITMFLLEMYFKSTFLLQLKGDTNLNQASPRCVVCEQQELLR